MTNKICPNCRVELDMGLTSCPLCGDDETVGKGNKLKQTANYPSEILHMEKRARIRLSWELYSIISASAILISLIVDLVISKGLNWSLYTTIFLAGGWVYVTLFTFSFSKRLRLFAGLLVNTLAMLLLIDTVLLPVHWFLSFTLPVTITFFVLLFIVLHFTGLARYKGFNILAIVFIAASIQCFVIELFIDLHIAGKVNIEWSAITASAVIPFSLILIFIHYRLKRGWNLKSYFHV